MKRLLIAASLILIPTTLLAGAVEQLESISGRKLGSVPVPMPGKPSPVGTAGTLLKGLSGAKGGGGGMDPLSMGLQILDMIDTLSSSPGGSPSPSEIAEQKRMEEERERARRRENAEQLRKFWDSADSLHHQRLQGVLDTPLFTPPPPLPPSETGHSTQTDQRTGPRFLAAVAENLRDSITGEVIDRGLSLLPAGWRVKLIYEHQQKMKTFIDEIFTTLDPTRITRTLALGTPSEMAALADEIDTKSTAAALKLVQPGEFLQGNEPEHLVRFAKGGKVTTADALSIAKGRLSSFIADRVKGKILLGDD